MKIHNPWVRCACGNVLFFSLQTIQNQWKSKSKLSFFTHIWYWQFPFDIWCVQNMRFWASWSSQASDQCKIEMHWQDTKMTSLQLQQYISQVPQLTCIWKPDYNIFEAKKYAKKRVFRDIWQFATNCVNT